MPKPKSTVLVFLYCSFNIYFFHQFCEILCGIVLFSFFGKTHSLSLFILHACWWGAGYQLSSSEKWGASWKSRLRQTTTNTQFHTYRVVGREPKQPEGNTRKHRNMMQTLPSHHSPVGNQTPLEATALTTAPRAAPWESYKWRFCISKISYQQWAPDMVSGDWLTLSSRCFMCFTSSSSSSFSFSEQQDGLLPNLNFTSHILKRCGYLSPEWSRSI